MCIRVVEASGPLVPLDVDDGRIVVLRGANSVELLDQAGTTLRAFTPTATPLAAVLSGRTLAVLVQGALQVYDTRTGALTHRRRLTSVTSSGHLQLVAAVHGLALYVLNGSVHLLRLRDGRNVTIAEGAAAADLTTQGLFYAFSAGHWEGRVRFTPYAKLPLKD